MRQNKFRWVYMVAVGIVLSFVMKGFVYADPGTNPNPFDFLITILITLTVWEGNLRLDHWLNQKVPWVNQVFKRIVIQFVASLLFTCITMYTMIRIFNTLTGCSATKTPSMLWNSLLMGLVVSLFLLILEISSQFFRAWKNSLIEIEQYKSERSEAALHRLKEQINPHFLFNNLSVLTALVYENADKAADFINHLSKVYRHVLEQRQEELITLEEEMRFLHSYTTLLAIRFEDCLHFDFKITQQAYHQLIPPMCLQILVENAIQHNEASKSHPLTVSIHVINDAICVFNRIQPRHGVEKGTGTGLKNICSRYHYFTSKEVVITQDNHVFKVCLPLLQIQKAFSDSRL